MHAIKMTSVLLLSIGLSVVASASKIQTWSYKKCESLHWDGSEYTLAGGTLAKFRAEFDVLTTITSLGGPDGRSVILTTDDLYRMYGIHVDKAEKLEKEKYGLWRQKDRKIEGPWGRENGFDGKRLKATILYEEHGKGVPNAVQAGFKDTRPVITTVQTGVNSDKVKHHTIEKYDNQGNHVELIVWEEKEGLTFRVFRACGDNFGFKVLPGKRQPAKGGEFTLELGK